MSEEDDFFDFMVFYELMFPDDPDKTFECPFCRNVIEGNEQVEVDRERNVFKCPACGQEIEVE